jgi:hypothetical protein
MKRSISLFPKCSTTTKEEEEEACGNKHTMGGGFGGLGEFGCEYEEGTFFEKSNENKPFFGTFFEKSSPNNPFFLNFYVLAQFHHT